jgi:hypothetical protein
MYLNLARLLWGFNIEHARDENGNILPVDFTTDGLLPGAMCTAIPFQCCTPPFQFGCLMLAITVRSPKHEKILRQEWMEAEKVGVDFSHMQWDKSTAA